MNTLRTWFLFHAPERDFRRLSRSLQDVPAQLAEMDRERRRLQREIHELGKQNVVCHGCTATCCEGTHTRFTMVDVLMRRFTDRPVEVFARFNKVEPLWLMAWRRYFPSKTPPFVPVGRCDHISEKGCALEPEDRPIRCLIWTCRAYRKGLPEDVLEKMGAAGRKLMKLSNRAIRLYRGACDCCCCDHSTGQKTS